MELLSTKNNPCISYPGSIEQFSQQQRRETLDRIDIVKSPSRKRLDLKKFKGDVSVKSEKVKRNKEIYRNQVEKLRKK